MNFFLKRLTHIRFGIFQLYNSIYQIFSTLANGFFQFFGIMKHMPLSFFLFTQIVHKTSENNLILELHLTYCQAEGESRAVFLEAQHLSTYTDYFLYALSVVVFNVIIVSTPIRFGH